LLVNSPNAVQGYNIDDLPSSLRHDIFTAVEQRCSLKNRFSKEDQEIVFQAWRKYFCGKKLVLGEFLGEHWSSLVFQHIVCSSETYDDINCLELRSNEVNQERLCFLFELKESRWKPQLRVMLHKLPNLTTVTLHDFCDDDTLSMVAHQCHHLANLTITLGPESFSEQQLGDDGFSDLLDVQLERQTLKELNISSCYSSTITAKSILYLSKIRSLVSLEFTSSHLIWLDISMRFIGKDIQLWMPNTTLERIGLRLGHDMYNNISIDPSSVGASGIIERAITIFPCVKEIQILNYNEAINNLEGKTFRDIQPKIFHASVKKCRNFTSVNNLFPCVRTLELDIAMNPKVENGVLFSCLKELTVQKEMFPIDFELIHDLMGVCLNLKKIKVNAVTMSNYNEQKFIDLFKTKPHLKQLERFSFNFKASCKISGKFLLCLLETCPSLEIIENTLSWDLGIDDLSILPEYDKVAMFASKYHWSLPWRCEDGQLVEVEQHRAAHDVGDMFDNF